MDHAIHCITPGNGRGEWRVHSDEGLSAQKARATDRHDRRDLSLAEAAEARVDRVVTHGASSGAEGGEDIATWPGQ